MFAAVTVSRSAILRASRAPTRLSARVFSRAASASASPAPVAVASAEIPAAAVEATAAAANPANPSTLWTKFVAFCGGVAVGGVYFIYLQSGGLDGDDRSELAAGFSRMAKESADSRVDVQRRLAVLEHEVATLRTEIAARGP